MPTRSTPARLDAAVEALLAGQQPLVSDELRPLVATAALTADALRPFPAGPRFEARLADRLAHPGTVRRAADAVLAHPGRLLAAGAVSTAAVGVTVTAFAVWRSTRRHGPAQRMLHR